VTLSSHASGGLKIIAVAGHVDTIREALDGANTTMQMAVDAGMEF